MSKFEDLMSALATDAEQSFATPEEIQEIVNEYSGKDGEIAQLKESLSAKEKEYEALKSRIVEHLFSNPKGTPAPEPEPEGEPEEPKAKTFNDIIDSQFSIRYK